MQPITTIPGELSAGQSLEMALARWRDMVGSHEPSLRPGQTHAHVSGVRSVTFGPPASEAAIDHWEETHGFRLPFGLKCWLRISDGLFVDDVRWIHPLRCIGPMVRFRPGTALLQQPSSWYEFGNPFDSPVNMDLIDVPDETDARTPVFVNDSDSDESFRVIADHFSQWFGRVVGAGFRPYWKFDSDPVRVDPVALHYARLQPPKLPPKLCRLCLTVGDQIARGMDERVVMNTHDLNRSELEQILSAYQYRRQKSLSR